MTTTDTVGTTGYDETIDVFYGTRPPEYWTGSRSPHISAGISPEFGEYLCSRFGQVLSTEDRSRLMPEHE